MLLKIGSTGDDVKALQKKLGLSADGSFGPATKAAVKIWQQANGLTADGVVGDTSWAALFPDGNNKSATTLHLDKLNGVVPDAVVAQLPDVCAKFNVSNILRLAHFLAQCAHESGGFKFIEENLNYSATGLQSVFPRYFPGNLSQTYARNPKKIASRVYANRMGNGDEASGEGYTFRGRGYIQLTGKSNYNGFAQFVGVDTVANPDLVANTYPLASAAFFFTNNKLWELCDQGSGTDTVTAITKRVNGGTNGLADRISYFQKYYACLTR